MVRLNNVDTIDDDVPALGLSGVCRPAGGEQRGSPVRRRGGAGELHLPADHADLPDVGPDSIPMVARERLVNEPFGTCN